jgi:hypothetical protein
MGHLGAAGHLDGILQAMAPTAQGMVSERSGAPLLSFGKTVTRPLDGYKNGYNRQIRQTNKHCKI